jgi:putative hemolysin
LRPAGERANEDGLQIVELYLEVALILFLVVLNGFLSGSELALVSARKARLQQRAERGDSGARAAVALTEDPNRFLATVQVGITLVGILAGAFAGATVAETLADRLAELGLSETAAGTLAVAAVVAAVTYLSLILGELVPKRIALAHPEALASRAARPMRLLSTLLAPAVALLGLSTRAVLRLLGVKAAAGEAVTEEELQLLLRQSAESGAIERGEHEIASAALRLGDLRLSDRMTPRPQVAWLDVTETAEATHAVILSHPHDRFPVCEGSPDEVLGIVAARDFLVGSLKREPFDLRALVKPALFLPESLTLLTALDRFRQERASAAIVIDEFGGTAGFVTLTDFIEPVMGELPSEEQQEPLVVEREDGSLLIDGQLPTADLKRRLGVVSLPDEEEYQTLAGFVLIQLGRVPRTGERFEWDGFAFEVVDMDGHRVDEVLVSRTGSTGES